MNRILIRLFYRILIVFCWFECNRTVLAQTEMLAEELPYKYCGNSFSHKFHSRRCPFGLCISKSHLVLFHFRKNAIEAHYAPCKYCLPPVWWSVHGVILQPATDSVLEHTNITGENEKHSD